MAIKVQVEETSDGINVKVLGTPCMPDGKDAEESMKAARGAIRLTDGADTKERMRAVLATQSKETLAALCVAKEIDEFVSECVHSKTCQKMIDAGIKNAKLFLCDTGFGTHGFFAKEGVR